MSNIYSKLTIEEKNFHFLDLKKLSAGQFWKTSTHKDIITEFKTSCCT